MREDMAKVIVERPRKYKGNDAAAVRRRDDFDSPQFLGIRAGYGHANERLHLYGSRSVYALAKQQLSRRELKAHGLR
jgi:hypothetical protein